MKELIMKNFNLTSEVYDNIFEKQLNFLKEKFPSGSIENLTKMATNTVRTVALRNKILGRKEQELLVIGFYERPKFNEMRINKANKNIDLHGSDKGLEVNITEKLMNKKGEYINYYGNIIDALDPNCKNIHIVHAVDNENNLKVLRLNEHFLGLIEVGKIYLFDYQNFKSIKTYFDKPFFTVNNVSNIENDENQPTIKNINKITLKVMNEQILPKIKKIKLESDLEKNLVNNYVAIKVNILDLKETPWNTELTCLLADDINTLTTISITIPTASKKLIIGEYITPENLGYLELYIIGAYNDIRTNREGDMTHYINGEIICMDEYLLENKKENVKIEIKEVEKKGELGFE